jgi:8-oxo-dGTP diphosphatase
VTLVRAAGGLITRFDDQGDLEVVVVHRARYNDWSFPKGKLDEGEGFEDAALREVAEETGLVCRLDGELAPVRYVAGGRPKIVRYWRMTRVNGNVGDFVLNDEIDDVRWVPKEAAETLLTYEHDRELLAGLQTADPNQSRKLSPGSAEADPLGS